MADVFRQPLVIPRAKTPAAQQPDIPRNLLLTTLAAVVAIAPFVNRDQPNPTRRAVVAQQETSRGRLPSSIPPPPPFVIEDQPRPTTRLPYTFHESSLGRLPTMPSMRIPGARELPQPPAARRVDRVASLAVNIRPVVVTTVAADTRVRVIGRPCVARRRRA